MTTYTAKFTGRQVGAIGKVQQFTEQVAASDMGAARLALYETHEHISDLVLSENRDCILQWGTLPRQYFYENADRCGLRKGSINQLRKNT